MISRTPAMLHCLPPVNKVQADFYAGKLGFLQNTGEPRCNKRQLSVGAGNTNALTSPLAPNTDMRQYKIQHRSRLNSWQDTSVNGREFQPEPVPSYPVHHWCIPPGGPAVPGTQVFGFFGPSDSTKGPPAIFMHCGWQGKSFILGGAVRYEQYKNLRPSTTTSVVRSPAVADNALPYMGSVSTGFRAPSLHQRYFQNTVCGWTS